MPARSRFVPWDRHCPIHHANFTAGSTCARCFIKAPPDERGKPCAQCLMESETIAERLTREAHQNYLRGLELQELEFVRD